MTKLFERVQSESTDCQRQSRIDFTDLIEANHSACTVIFDAIDRHELKPGKKDQSTGNRLLLSSNFIQGIHLTETAIIGGFYSQGAALVRQEMETLAALEEHKKGNWNPGKTPNVKILGWMAIVYGELNNLTHLGHPSVLGPLQHALQTKTPGAQPTAIFPIYNKNYAKPLYGQHTLFVGAFALKLAEILNDLYGQAFTPREFEILISVIRVLQESGIIGPSNSSNDSASCLDL